LLCEETRWDTTASQALFSLSTPLKVGKKYSCERPPFFLLKVQFECFFFSLVVSPRKPKEIQTDVSKKSEDITKLRKNKSCREVHLVIMA
jgi:hypothetical protein